jgi:glycosyltransferase involved in cell wall biosynthesis
MQLRRFQPAAIVCQSPYETAAVLLSRKLTHADVAVIAEVHGDWRTATRLYGSRGRALARPIADAIAVRALRGADGIRTLSGFTTRLVREAGAEPTSTFPTWTDRSSFVESAPAPLPDRPRVLFVGVLQPYKNIEGLVETWRLVAPRAPEATMQVVGRGPQAHLVEALAREFPGRVEWTPSLTAPEVARVLDASTLLFLPSRREGLGRVVIESLARGRPVVASGTGGIPDLVTPGVNGALFDPDDHTGMADELVRLLESPGEAARLSAGARASIDALLWTPEEYARDVRELVDDAVSS